MLRYTFRSLRTTFVSVNSRGQVRGLTEGRANRRPKKVKVKKGEGRRVLREQPEQSALTTTSASPPPSNQVFEPQYYHEQPLGERLKTSFLWGLGISLGFSIVGVFFRAFMQEVSYVIWLVDFSY
jgi:hypothetical protein